MIIGIPKEIKPDEKRVSITPDKIKGLIDAGHKIIFERGAGQNAGFPDSAYSNIEIVSDVKVEKFSNISSVGFDHDHTFYTSNRYRQEGN